MRRRKMIMKGRISKVNDSIIIFPRNNKILYEYHRTSIVISVDNMVFLGRVQRYANRFVIYIPRTEDYNYLEKKMKEKKIIEFNLLSQV
jgi:hypothetical protein